MNFSSPAFRPWLLAVFFAYPSCAPKRPGAPGVPLPVPVSQPVFDKTFGEVEIGGGSTLSIQFKSIHLLVDPFQFQDDASSVDYLLLTDGKSVHFGSGSTQGIRRNLKIICAKNAERDLQRKGFTQVKSLPPGSRILLQKNGGSLFVTSFENKTASGKESVNSYLLEFDNGRNLFISGDLPEADLLRETVYQLRDDGKEIHFGFIYASSAEDNCAKLLALLQPKFGFVISSGAPNPPQIKEDVFRSKLKEELFDGFALIPRRADKFPF